ncbi:hypothetical protein D3C78_1089070 [compost metagenome]
MRIPLEATMPNMAMPAPPSTAGGIEATTKATLGSMLRAIRKPAAATVTKRLRTPVICTRPIFWAKDEWVKVFRKPARKDAPASQSRPRRRRFGQISVSVSLPRARNMPVDSTKMITTTRHIDSTGAR